MSDRSKEYRCHYCGFKTTTSGQLSSHFSQSPPCLDKIVAANQPSSNIHKRDCSPTPGGSGHLNDQPDDELLYSSLLMGQPSSKRARVEEDIPIKIDTIFEEFTPPAGESQPKPPNMSNNFEGLLADQQASRSEPWAPFSSMEDWDYARWITNSGLSQRQIDSMLALDLVSKICLFASITVTHQNLVEICIPVLSQ